MSDLHFNRTGFYFNTLMYDLKIDHADADEQPKNIIDTKGQSVLFQFYSQSQYKLTPKFTLNAGFHSQYFQLNQDFTFEPRVSLKYQLNEKSDLALAYGLHSKTESLGMYFVKDELGNEPNKDLKLMRSNHLVLSFNTMLNDHLRVSIEPYYQYLTNVPVAPDSYISTLNNQDNLFFDQPLISAGTGRNLGVDMTVEQYLKDGFYSLLTASVFDSKYTANDGIERNTRLNKNYVFNAVVGKEWQLGRDNNNILSVNIRLNYLGGSRAEAIDEVKSFEEQRIVYGESNGERSFTRKHNDTPIWSFTLFL